MGQLEGKVAVVTGGANGIGRACCESFAAEGADIVLGDVAEEHAIETVKRIEAHGRQGEFVFTNVASKSDNEALIDAAIARFGHVDVLLTAAGVPNTKYKTGRTGGRVPHVDDSPELRANVFVEMAAEEWQGVLDVNLTGTFFAMQAAGRQMVKQGSGSIIAIASIAAKIPFGGGGQYSVSKAGVWMLTKNAAMALGPSNVRVNAVGPGYIETSMTAPLIDDASWMESINRQTALGRMGTPEEVAEVAVFLASDHASYVTGQLMHPDGGIFTG
jgi:NAD(P)-dependent dehydrogenase (short-subunit alcohol dehydrogenase family)